jgi:hypothetical protein
MMKTDHTVFLSYEEYLLSQLNYVIGRINCRNIKRYFHDFKFKHPTPNDIKRSAERVSELI